MISTRSLVLAGLILLPLLIYLVVGGYAIVQIESLWWIWWLMTGCSVAAWGLSRLWPAGETSARPQHQLDESRHWTPRDREAAQVIREYQQRVESLTAAGLVLSEPDGSVRYAPVSDDLDRLAAEAEARYARSPDAVRRLIVTAANPSVSAFADAFRLRKD